MPTFLVILCTAKAIHFTISKLLPCTLFLASTGLFLLCFDTSSLHLDLMENEYYSKLGTYLDRVIQTAALAGIKPKMMLVGTKAEDIHKCKDSLDRLKALARAHL